MRTCSILGPQVPSWPRQGSIEPKPYLRIFSPSNGRSRAPSPPFFFFPEHDIGTRPFRHVPPIWGRLEGTLPMSHRRPFTALTYLLPLNYLLTFLPPGPGRCSALWRLRRGKGDPKFLIGQSALAADRLGPHPPAPNHSNIHFGFDVQGIPSFPHIFWYMSVKKS